jgi:uncharacterized protein (DUF924 family)
MKPETILEFWIGSGPDPFANAARWWKKDPAFDAEIAERFGPTLAACARGELEAWREAPKSCAAYIILIDQFSRNIHRNEAAAFALDDRARAACIAGIARGLDAALGPVERLFFYMPLVHTEDVTVQDRAIVLLATLMEEASADARKTFVDSVVAAVKHRKIVARFGRFPHRNAILGRASTEEELAFLKTPGSSF